MRGSSPYRSYKVVTTANAICCASLESPFEPGRLPHIRSARSRCTGHIVLLTWSSARVSHAHNLIIPRSRTGRRPVIAPPLLTTAHTISRTSSCSDYPSPIEGSYLCGLQTKTLFPPSTILPSHARTPPFSIQKPSGGLVTADHVQREDFSSWYSKLSMPQ